MVQQILRDADVDSGLAFREILPLQFVVSVLARPATNQHRRHLYQVYIMPRFGL